MIFTTLNFLCQEARKFLSLKLGPSTLDRVVLGNISRVYDDDGKDTKIGNMNDNVVISLVNVEEDRVAKIHANSFTTANGVEYKNPPVLLNLYVLFSVNKDNYADSLLWLSHIIQCFQFQNVFTPQTHPGLDASIVSLMMDMHTMNFEQQNQLWGTLGGKYIPSVLYKIRQLTIDENAVEFTAGFIKEIKNDVMQKEPVI